MSFLEQKADDSCSRDVSGKPGIAPCGHPGTYVTSTFITCNERCEFQTAKPVVARRGEPGHVDMCACAPCQIRRRTEYINLIDKSGQLVHSLPWDGVKNELDWIPTRAAEIRHWRMRDKAGDLVASGNLAFDLAPNRKAHLNIKLFMDAADRVTLSIEQEKYWDIEHYHIEWKTSGKDFAASVKEMLASTGFPADSFIGRMLIEYQEAVEAELRRQVAQMFPDTATDDHLDAMVLTTGRLSYKDCVHRDVCPSTFEGVGEKWAKLSRPVPTGFSSKYLEDVVMNYKHVTGVTWEYAEYSLEVEVKTWGLRTGEQLRELLRAIDAELRPTLPAHIRLQVRGRLPENCI